MKKILSLDGGGIRGLYTARVLAELETRFGCQVADVFDLVAGVSTGGILACMLCSPRKYRASDVEAFYRKEGPNIFHSSVDRKVQTLYGLRLQKYDNTALLALLQKYLGNTMLSQTVKPILVNAFDLGNEQSFFFKTTKARQDSIDDYPLWKVAQATAAAPTYFDPAVVSRQSEIGLADGGLFATNPAMCAYAEARVLWPEEDRYLVVSLGTGRGRPSGNYQQYMHKGELGWILSIVDLILDAGAETTDYQMKALNDGSPGSPQYWRIQSALQYASGAMDDASGTNLDNLIKDADLTIARFTWHLDEIVKELKK